MYRFLEDHDEFHDSHDDDHDEMINLNDDKPWGEVIGATAAVQAVTLAGLVFVAFSFCTPRNNNNSAWSHYIHKLLVPSFAGGALLATAVFLIIPESLKLLQGAHASGDSHSEDEYSHSSNETTTYDEVHEDDSHDENDGGDHSGHNHFFRYLEEEDAHHDEEPEDHIWKFGAALMAGFLIPILLGAIFPPPDVSTCQECLRAEEARKEAAAMLQAARENGSDDDDKEEPKANSVLETCDLACEEGTCGHVNNNTDDDDDNTKPSLPTKETSTSGRAAVGSGHSRNWALASSILLGDAFHNFTDGIFIGNAFLLCNSSLAWTITATTVYHELAQEIADYSLLVHHCGLDRWTALAANFLSGFSVMIGAVLIFSLELSEQSMGIVLAMSAGVYLYISATECVPRLIRERQDQSENGRVGTLLFLLCFIAGAVPIGLVLLDHGHCEEH